MNLPNSIAPSRWHAPLCRAMHRLLRVAAVLAFAMLPAAAYSADARESFSNLPGYFLGSMMETTIGPGHPKQYIDEIKTVCERRGEIWALGVPTPFRCTRFEPYPKDGDYAARDYFLGIKPEQRVRQPDDRTLEKMQLFSLRRFPDYVWKSRRATGDEASAVTMLFKGSGTRLKAAQRAFASGKAMVLDSPDGNATTFVMLWKHVHDGPLDETNPVYLTATKKSGQYSRTDEINGSITGMVDVNGDGIPEFRVSEDCDGTCEALVSLNKRIGIWISAH